MSNFKLNPLRIISLIVLGILILSLLFKNVIPRHYKITSEAILSNPSPIIETNLTELHNLLLNKNSDALFVDLRDANQFSTGHIDNALNIPVLNLLDKSNLQIIRNKQVYLYSDDENLSYQVALLLFQLGYSVSPINGNYKIIKSNVIDNFNPEYSKFSEEKQHYNYSEFIKQQPEKQEFKVDVKKEVKKQGGC